MRSEQQKRSAAISEARTTPGQLGASQGGRGVTPAADWNAAFPSTSRAPETETRSADEIAAAQAAKTPGTSLGLTSKDDWNKMFHPKTPATPGAQPPAGPAAAATGDKPSGNKPPAGGAGGGGKTGTDGKSIPAIFTQGNMAANSPGGSSPTAQWSPAGDPPVNQPNYLFDGSGGAGAGTAPRSGTSTGGSGPAVAQAVPSGTDATGSGPAMGDSGGGSGSTPASPTGGALTAANGPANSPAPASGGGDDGGGDEVS